MKPGKNNFLSKVLLILLILNANILFLTTSCSSYKQNEKPNIVIILADDMGWKDAGFMGSKYYDTPAIDALAASGMIFTDAYSNAPNCAPTRACLLTGLYSPRHGIYTVNSSARGKSALRKIIPIENKTILDTSYVTIAELLKKNGYVTTSIGKWHLGSDSIGLPQSQGFDENVGGYHLGHPRSYFSPYQNPYLPDGHEGEYLTDRLTDEAIDFIERNKEHPFFLYLPHYAVHTPIQAEDSLISIFRNKEPDGGQNNPVYAAMIKSLDESVGEILMELKNQNLLNNTIVIFMSDNGGRSRVTSMSPLRGSKGMLYEGGIRVPLIVSWEGKIEANSKNDLPVIGTDIFPTIVELTHTSIPDNFRFDGISLADNILGKEEIADRPVFWHFPVYLERYGGMKTVWRTTPASAVRLGDWKLIEFYENGKVELYNLNDDIGETNDVSQEFPEKKEKLYDILDKWRTEINAPVPTLLNPEFDQQLYDKERQKLIDN